MIFEKDELMGVLPTNKEGNICFSHSGLTYGGFVLKPQLKFEAIKILVKSTLEFLNRQGIKSLKLKMIPRIYQHRNNDAMDYLMFILNTKLYRSDLLSVVRIGEGIFSRDRIAGYKRGIKNSLVIKEEEDLADFWECLLIPTLRNKHQVSPVHSIEEINLLKSRFKNNIRQFNVYHNDKMVAGTTIFETEYVAHSQYIASNSQKNELGSLDFLHMHLIKEVFRDKKYFDFGISSKDQGRVVNKGLLYWKEGFGTSGYIQNFYEIKTDNYNILNEVFI